MIKPKLKVVKSSCGKGKKGCNYEGEPKLVSTTRIAA